MKEPYSAGAAAVGLRLRQQRLKRGWKTPAICGTRITARR